MTIEICRTTREFRVACDRLRAEKGLLGLVPTMGALHRGHLDLIREARRRAGAVAVTLFVNPTQFGPREDFGRYPRAWEDDLRGSAEAGAALLFAPSVEEMYPAAESTRVAVGGLSDHLCGRARPGHLEGVATIVAKFFIIAGPCVAVFGRKDYQQLKVVQRLARDLLLPVEVVGHPTVREPDGLALSSRNAYLDPGERERALAIPRALSQASACYSSGERRVGVLCSLVRGLLEAARVRVDYVSLADADALVPYGDGDLIPDRALLAVAGFVGSTRLIDNLVFSEDPPPLPLPRRHV